MQAVDFRWKTYPSGHEWVREEGEAFLAVRPCLDPPRIYFPMKDETGLFRVFADTKTDPDGLMAFADRYGLMGEDRPPGTLGIMITTPDGATYPPIRPEATPEQDVYWVSQIKRMRQAVGLWEMARRGNVEGLKKNFQWVDNACWYRHRDLTDQFGNKERRFKLIESSHHPEDLYAPTPRGQFIEPALYRVRQLVNESLHGRVSVELRHNRDHGTALYQVPSNLLGAIWLQFALAVDGNKDYRQCRQCNKWFELSPQTARRNKRYCTEACKSRAYRARLHAEKEATK